LLDRPIAQMKHSDFLLDRDQEENARLAVKKCKLIRGQCYGAASQWIVRKSVR
jgi:hypothetical protein